MQTTDPTHEVLTVLARAEIDEDVPADAVARLVATLTPHLDGERRDLWWGELKMCLSRADAAESGGPAWDEAGIDWTERATEALGYLTDED